MASHFNIITRHRDIEWYNEQYENNRYSLSPWQRDDCWTKEYKKTLIKSILLGIDIPKIYIGQIGTEESIMDGGHRTRAINEFINNKFSINIDEQEVFYDRNIEQTTRNTRNLNNQEKRNFLRFELTVTTYMDITQSDCRMIFNILQNAQPMSVADVINSHQSFLVDYLRGLSTDHVINGVLLKDIILDKKILSNTNNSELLYQLASWFTIINPIIVDEDDVEEEVSMKYLEKGLTRKSMCLQYVKKHRAIITDEIKNHFEDRLNYIVQYPNINKITPSDINTLLHSKEWIPQFSSTKFNEFLNKVSDYSNLKSASGKKCKKGEFNEGQVLSEQANELDEEYDGNLSIWKNSRTSGGSNFSGMSKRKTIVEEYCCE